MYRLKLFYRDGDNYKCTWDVEIEDEVWEDFSEGMSEDEYLDPGYLSDPLFEIYDLGLSEYNIPLIKEYGHGEMDHPYISIVSVEKID